MLETLKQFGEFLLFTVIIKIIVAHWLANMIMKFSKRWFSQTERNLAIWNHYQARAQGLGHEHKSILHCTEGRCVVI